MGEQIRKGGDKMKPLKDLKELIDEKGIKYDFIAKKLDMPSSTFTNYLKHHNKKAWFSLEKCEKLSLIVGCDMGIFIEESVWEKMPNIIVINEYVFFKNREARTYQESYVDLNGTGYSWNQLKNARKGNAVRTGNKFWEVLTDGDLVEIKGKVIPFEKRYVGKLYIEKAWIRYQDVLTCVFSPLFEEERISEIA